MSDTKKRLIESLKLHAKQIGNKSDFWEQMAERIVLSRVDGISRSQIRAPKHPGLIAKDIHNFLCKDKRYNDLSEAQRAVYYKIIKIVLLGLGYGELDEKNEQEEEEPLPPSA